MRVLPVAVLCVLAIGCPQSQAPRTSPGESDLRRAISHRPVALTTPAPQFITITITPKPPMPNGTILMLKVGESPETQCIVTGNQCLFTTAYATSGGVSVREVHEKQAHTAIYWNMVKVGK